MKIPFNGRILLLGSGSVSQCLQPLLLRHIDMNFSQLIIMDSADRREEIPDSLAAGAQYVQVWVTRQNYSSLLATYLRPGDLFIDLAWGLESGELIDWCQDHNILYVNTSLEEWDTSDNVDNIPPNERALYGLHMALRKRSQRWSRNGPTAIIEHGANPGLVNHWTKIALKDISMVMLRKGDLATDRRAILERSLENGDYARLAMATGTKVIHISERDTQISNQPKQVDEFVNTWSVDVFYEESLAPVEIGWGTHERSIPTRAFFHQQGPRNQISLGQMGMKTLIRSWVPIGGEIIGMAIRHEEVFTISDYLTVWNDYKPIYRPTVLYVYLPTDAAWASLHEVQMRNYQLPAKKRIMKDDIIDGRDEVGVLLLGHDLNAWWIGSQLDIHETRRIVAHQNATTLQVAASALSAIIWMLRNPQRGFNLPEQLPSQEILEICKPYLGPCPSIPVNWSPLINRYDPFQKFGRPTPLDEDEWQFGSFLA
jgi:homospermidine synthase